MSAKVIRSISVAPLTSTKFRGFAWSRPGHDPNQPVGTPIGVIDGDSLGEVLYQMLRVVRGERGFDESIRDDAPELFEDGE